MPDAARRLPARPSLEQLRKQAKDLLHQIRAGDVAALARMHAVIPQLPEPEQPTLSDAQLVLAREYGFSSWPKLVHHVETANPTERLEQFSRLAEDMLAAYRGDAEALRRISEMSGSSFSLERLQNQVTERLAEISGVAEHPGAFTGDDAQLLIARQYGFESWAKLVESFSQPPRDPRSTTHRFSSAPPFYRIDLETSSIEPRLPLSDHDWDVIIEVMKEFGITHLNAGGQMTDSAMARIAELGQITRLNLNGCQRLSDDGVLQLARMPQLRDLDLSGWHSPLTDRGLAVLRHLPELRKFSLCWPQRVSDAGVANLSGCELLENVNVMGTPTGDGGIRALAGKRNLARFKTGKQVTDAGLRLLHQFPVFKSWQGGELSYGLMGAETGPNHLMVDGPFTDQGLTALVGLDGLFGINFFWHTTVCTSDGLKVLAQLPRLGMLGCEGKLCDNVGMRHIGALPHLRQLMAQGTVASDEGFIALSRSKTIEHIWGRDSDNLTGRGFSAMAAMPALQGLAVDCKQVDDTSLATLPSFPALRALVPMNVLDEGFLHVGRCEQLEKLWCMYCRETGDRATEHIAGLTRLNTYYAGKTLITDRSLEILARMNSLEKLEFWETAGITNAGLATPAALPRLREIEIGGARGVTREGLAVFPATVRVTYE
jgi:hypothetical protein